MFEELEKRVRDSGSLIERLGKCCEMIGKMCKEGRPPKMTIPVQWHDEDIFISVTLEDAIVAAQKLENEVSCIPCVKCKGEVVEFSVPNDIWNIVVRKNGKETDKEYLCINCWYDILRVAIGIEKSEAESG